MMSRDIQAAYAWMIRGLGGITNMLATETKEQTPITPYWLDQLREEHERIGNLIKQLQKADNAQAQETQSQL